MVRARHLGLSYMDVFTCEFHLVKERKTTSQINCYNHNILTITITVASKQLLVSSLIDIALLYTVVVCAVY